MSVWVVEIQTAAERWILWDVKRTEEEANECAETTERNSGWNVSVREYVPAKASTPTGDPHGQ